MKKRILSLICLVCLVGCIIPLPTAAAELTAQGYAKAVGEPETISAGYYHTMVIRGDSTLWGWGSNEYGQLGDGTTTSSTVPVQILTDVTAVSAGRYHTVAIRSDGSLWAWGNADTLGNGGIGNEEIADGYTTVQTVPVKVLTDVAAVCAGSGYTLALKTDGTLWSWGAATGNFGKGLLPIQIMTGVAAIGTGSEFSMAIKTDGTLWAWGWSVNGLLGDDADKDYYQAPVQIMTDVAAVSMGRGYAVVIKPDGTLWSWGRNECGQLGDGTTTMRRANPAQVMSDVVSVSTGTAHMMALKADGLLWSWGNNFFGELGDGTTEVRHSPAQIMAGVAAVSAGEDYTIAVKTDGTLWAWGTNDYGNLGDGTRENRASPVQIMTGVATPSQTLGGYVYDTPDAGEGVALPIEKLDAVTSSGAATTAVTSAVSGMTAQQKESATGADRATLFAEEAVSRAASKKVTGAVNINAAAVADLQKVAATTAAAVETALVSGGVTTARYLANTVRLTTDETGPVTITIDPDILQTEVDKVRVETPTYAITIKMSDIAADLTAGKPITITAEDVGTGFAAGSRGKSTTVKLNLPNGKTSNPVTVSLPASAGDANYQAVTSTEGKTAPSKQNPATGNMDAKVAESGTYTVKTNQKDFGDIAAKSAEMQKAIRYLASKGIIDGTTATTFSPDGPISRAEIASLIMRALGKLDSKAKSSYPDVKSSDWYYAAAGSSTKHGIMNGLGNGSFSGTTVIAKDQLVSVAARVLRAEMNYKAPSNAKTYLAKYGDTVAPWAQSDVALATRENMVIQRIDGTFKGTGNMTRGNACIIIYRLFNKIW